MRWQAAILLVVIASPLTMAGPASKMTFRPQLTKVELDTDIVAIGDTIHAKFWWRNVGNAPADEDYVVLVQPRLAGKPEDQEAYPSFGADFAPLPRTHRWTPGRVYFTAQDIPFPQSAPPGKYDLLLGLYSRVGPRIPLANSAQAATHTRTKVAEIEVLPKGRAYEARSYSATFFDVAKPGEQPQLPETTVRTASIRSEQMEVILDATRPIVYTYRYLPDGPSLLADIEGVEPIVRLCRLADGLTRHSFSPQIRADYDARFGESEATFRCNTTWDNHPVAAYTLRFAVEGETVTVTLEDVSERPGYQLVVIEMPGLLTTLASQGGQMVLPYLAGRLVDPKLCLPRMHRHRVSMGGDPRACGVMATGQMVGALDLNTIDDVMISSVMGFGLDKAASLRVEFQHRAPANKPELQFVIHAKTSVRLDFVRGKPGQMLSWTDGARLIRQRIAVRLPDLYKDTIIYKIACDGPRWKHYTTFDESLDLIRKIHNLTDGMEQVAYLVGWQHHGHDTGYPDVFTINERLGGHDKLLNLMREARKYDCYVSFHDNYDDAYKESPAWDDEIMARGQNGSIMKGAVWAGGQSHIISYTSYLERGGLARVNRTLDMLPVEKSYHIDVMSAVPSRRDWNPKRPASSGQMLEARISIVKEFQKRGIDVTSEAFTAPFVGVLGRARALITRPERVLYTGEQILPFISFIYHGRAEYGGCGKASGDPYRNALIFGQNLSSVDFNKNSAISFICDLIYLARLPWGLLRDREMTAYYEHDSIRRVEYGKHSYVQVDDANDEFEIVVDGRLYARNYAVFVPGTRKGTWLAYAKRGAEVRFPCPPAWTGAVRAVQLAPHGEGDSTQVHLEGAEIVLTLPKQIPVRAWQP